ncbi:MAG TPA: PAS domain-containing protein [Bryobacteraceae bacterium]|nr:PAS domain-containing protein [Bryobacteraceae bacterium]
MSNLYARNQCEACQFPQRPDDQVVAHLLERISELEEENDNLRKLEETLRRNSYLFDMLLRGSREAILLLNPELTILRLVHSTLGYSARDLLGQPVLAFIHPDDAHLLEACCSDLLKSRAAARTIEMRGLGADGSWVWLEGYVTDMLDDPNVQAIVLNLRRIGESRQRIAPPAR